MFKFIWRHCEKPRNPSLSLSVIRAEKWPPGAEEHEAVLLTSQQSCNVSGAVHVTMEDCVQLVLPASVTLATSVQCYVQQIHDRDVDNNKLTQHWNWIAFSSSFSLNPIAIILCVLRWGMIKFEVLLSLSQLLRTHAIRLGNSSRLNKTVICTYCFAISLTLTSRGLVLE
jgi:hypothetical protein